MPLKPANSQAHWGPASMSPQSLLVAAFLPLSLGVRGGEDPSTEFQREASKEEIRFAFDLLALNV